jgi:hypothetical protein
MDYFEYMRSIRSARLSTKAKITALFIASYNPSYPTNKQLSRDTGLCERSVRNAKAELVAAGYLRQEMQWNAANHYTPLAPDAIGEAPDSHLNTNINTNINTKEIQINKSKDLFIDSKTKEIKESVNISLDTTEKPLAEIRANTAAEENIWAVFESR